MVCGTVVYNEIITIPYLGLDYYTRDNIAKREKESSEFEGEAPKPSDFTYEL